MTSRKTGQRPKEHVVAVLLLLDYEVLHCNINNLRKRTHSVVIVTIEGSVLQYATPILGFIILEH
jgi:hypothetical protein